MEKWCHVEPYSAFLYFEESLDPNPRVGETAGRLSMGEYAFWAGKNFSLQYNEWPPGKVGSKAEQRPLFPSFFYNPFMSITHQNLKPN